MASWAPPLNAVEGSRGAGIPPVLLAEMWPVEGEAREVFFLGVTVRECQNYHCDNQLLHGVPQIRKLMQRTTKKKIPEVPTRTRPSLSFVHLIHTCFSLVLVPIKLYL